MSKRKPVSPRSKQHRDQGEARRALVAALYLDHYRQGEIARELGVHINTVTADIKALREEWRAARLTNMDEIFAEQLAKLDQTEREAAAEWHRSKKDAEIQRTVRGPEGTTTTTERRGQCADPRYREIILKCIAQRCKLLGLEPPEKSEVQIYQPPLSREELAEKLRQQLSQFQEKDD